MVLLLCIKLANICMDLWIQSTISIPCFIFYSLVSAIKHIMVLFITTNLESCQVIKTCIADWATTSTVKSTNFLYQTSFINQNAIHDNIENLKLQCSISCSQLFVIKLWEWFYKCLCEVRTTIWNSSCMPYLTEEYTTFSMNCIDNGFHASTCSFVHMPGISGYLCIWKTVNTRVMFIIWYEIINKTRKPL